MASVNRVTILGNVGKDVELRYTQSGTPVCTLSVATTRKWKSKQSNEMMEETEWHRVTFFDRLAEIVDEYVEKGHPLYVEGRLKTEKYEKDGIDRYTTVIVAESMQLLGGRSEGSRESRGNQQRQSAPAKPAPRQPARSTTAFDDMDDSIPF